MTTTAKTLILGVLVGLIFSGCATKEKTAWACFKGTSSCYSQDITTQGNCSGGHCQVII